MLGRFTGLNLPGMNQQDEDEPFLTDFLEEDEIRNGSGHAQDYYGLLNVNRQSDAEEIKQSYKQLLLIYHPDKHIAEKDKQAASLRFQEIQTAYDCLCDPNKRYIYDLFGIEGLQQEWTIGSRLKSKEEIRDEYESRAKLKAELDKQHLVRSKGHILIGLDASVLFDSPRRQPFSFRSLFNFEALPEVTDSLVQHSWETRITDNDKLTLSGQVVSRNGIGGGNVSFQLTHVFEPTLFANVIRLLILVHRSGRNKQFCSSPSSEAIFR